CANGNRLRRLLARTAIDFVDVRSRVAVSVLRSADRRPAVGPGVGGLELRADLEEYVLARRARDELDRGRQAVVAVEEREHQRRLAGRVERGGERREAARGGERRERVLGVGVQRAERQRALRESRRDDDVERVERL